MGIKLRTTLKGFFETGDVPNQQQYHDFIDSNIILDDVNTGDLLLTGTARITGSLSASSHISSSETVFAKFFEPRVETSGIVTSSNTSGTNAFGSTVRLDTNKALTGKDSNGIAQNLVVNTGAKIRLADPDLLTEVDGTDITIDASNLIYIDSDGDFNNNVGRVHFRDSGVSSVLINTTNGHITASGGISSSLAISSSNGYFLDTGSKAEVKILGGDTSSLFTSASLSEVIFKNLPTTEPQISGALWLSGSVEASPSSSYLVVFTG